MGASRGGSVLSSKQHDGKTKLVSSWLLHPSVADTNNLHHGSSMRATFIDGGWLLFKLLLFCGRAFVYTHTNTPKHEGEEDTTDKQNKNNDDNKSRKTICVHQTTIIIIIKDFLTTRLTMTTKMGWVSGQHPSFHQLQITTSYKQQAVRCFYLPLPSEYK